jgi:hypothetical protein
MSEKAAWYAVVAVVLVALVMGWAMPAGAAPKIVYARIAVPQSGGKAAVAYLSIENNKLRVAGTIEGLASAALVKAQNSHLESIGWGEFYQSYMFPEVQLPITVNGYDRATIKPTYSRSGTKARGSEREREDWLAVYGELVLSRKDSKGVTWGHSLSLSSSDGGRQPYSAEHPLELSVPMLSQAPLTFEITAQVEGRNARIGMQIKSGKSDLHTVLKDGKGAPVRLEVLDKDRKVVASETGDPLKFGFT